MRLGRWQALWGSALVALACNGNTQPPGPPAQILKTGGDGQAGHFNMALPLPYSVTVLDANSLGVPGVSVDWSIITGGGSLSVNPSTTDSRGVGTTVHTLSAATVYVVHATVSGLPSVTFTASASATFAEGRATP